MNSEQYLRTNQNTRVVYNGKYKTRLGAVDVLPLKCGNLVAIDNNQDNFMDVVIIENYDTYYTEIESRFDSPVLDKYSGSVRLNLEEAEEIEVIRGGETEQYSSDSKILANQVVCVAMSEDCSIARIVICDEYISGAIKYVNKEEKLCEIDGRKIKASDYFIDSNQKMEATSDVVTAKLDVNGRIVYIEGVSGEKEYAYLRAVSEKDSLDGSVNISLIMQSGMAKTFKVTGKTVVNGSKNAVDAVLTFVPQAVKIRCHSDDTLASIDTAVENNLEPNEDVFTLDHSAQSSAWRAGGLNVFDAIYKLDSSTKVFMIPEDMTNISEYKVTGINDLYADFKYNIKIYDLNSGYVAAAVVIYVEGSERRTAATYDPVCIVDNVAEYIDNDGNNCIKVFGYVNGAYTEVVFDKDGAVDDTAWWSDYQKRNTSYGKNPFVRGEVFQYYSDSNGICKSIKMLLTSKLINRENRGFEHKIGDYEPLSENAYYSELYFALGKVTNKFADRVFICPNDEIGWLRTIPLNGTNVTVFDVSRDKLRIGDSADIYAGAEIFVHMYFGASKEILVVE